MSNGDTHEAQRKRFDEIIVDEPSEEKIVEALYGAAWIVRESWEVEVLDGMDERDPDHQVFTYLLAQYAAYRVSEGDANRFAELSDLYDLFPRKTVKKVLDHGWIRHWDGKVEIEPRNVGHTAEEMIWRYADGTGDSDE